MRPPRARTAPTPNRPGPPFLSADPFALPPELPVVWRPGLVVARVRQLWRMVHGYQREGAGPEPPEVPGMLAHLGLLEEQAWWLKWRAVCQLCGYHAALLVLDPSTTRWGCHCCCAPVLGSRLERTLAEIAFAGRIGLLDAHIARRQRWAMRELGRLAGTATTPRELVVLAVGTALLQRPRPWLRRISGSGGYLRQGRGPLWRRLSPEFAWAFADSVLAREAYRQRWGLLALFGVIDSEDHLPA